MTCSTHTPSDALAALQDRRGPRCPFPAGRGSWGPLPLCAGRGGKRGPAAVQGAPKSGDPAPGASSQQGQPPRLGCQAGLCPAGRPWGSARPPRSPRGRLPRPSAAKGLRHPAFPSSPGSTVRRKSRAGREGRTCCGGGSWSRLEASPSRRAPGSGAGEAGGAGAAGSSPSRGRSPSAWPRVPSLMRELLVPRQRSPPELALLPGEPGSRTPARTQPCRALRQRPTDLFV